MQLLAVDVGTGTQDILLLRAGLALENALQAGDALADDDRPPSASRRPLVHGAVAVARVVHVEAGIRRRGIALVGHRRIQAIEEEEPLARMRREVVEHAATDGFPLTGMLYRPAGRDPDVAVLAMHPRVDFSRHYVVPGLTAGGYAFMGAMTRYLNNDADALHERLVLDVAGSVAFLRGQGFRRVVLLGNSGGGSLFAFYLEQAGRTPGDRLARAPSGDAVPLREAPVELRLQDYRAVEGKYDRVISIGIMEHVGYKNYRIYMKVVDRTLKEDGIAFVHTIGDNITTTTSNAWLTKYIFPNGMLPSIPQLGKAMEGLFVMEDWHNFGPDYDRTLMAWHENFERAWPELKKTYSERFRRMWRFYLLSSAGGFRSRRTQLWQLVMTRPGTPQPACRVC